MHIVRAITLFVCGSVANSQEVPVSGATLQTAIVPWRHRCADVSLPGCLAAAWQDGAWTALHFPVLRSTSHILCTVRKSVEVWCKRHAPVKNVCKNKNQCPTMHYCILTINDSDFFLCQHGFLLAAEQKGFEVMELRGMDPRLASLDTLSGEQIPLHLLLRLQGYIIQVGGATHMWPWAVSGSTTDPLTLNLMLT